MSKIMAVINESDVLFIPKTIFKARDKEVIEARMGGECLKNPKDGRYEKIIYGSPHCKSN